MRDYLGASCLCASLRSVFSLVSTDLDSVLLEMKEERGGDVGGGGGGGGFHVAAPVLEKQDESIRLLQQQNQSLQQQNEKIVRTMSLLSIFAPRGEGGAAPAAHRRSTVI